MGRWTIMEFWNQIFTNRLFCFLEHGMSILKVIHLTILDYFDFWIMGGHAQSTAPNNTSYVYLAKHMSCHIICMLQTRSPKSVTIDSWFLALAFIWSFNQNWNLSTYTCQISLSQDITLTNTCSIFHYNISHGCHLQNETQEGCVYCWKLLKPLWSGLGWSSLNRIPLTVARFSHTHFRFKNITGRQFFVVEVELRSKSLSSDFYC